VYFLPKQGYVYLWHANQSKHLQTIKRKIKKRCNVLKKYKMQMCKWNVMCKSEMQHVRLNVQCPNNSYNEQTVTHQSKLPKKNMDNQNK
jgi:hypothetical protein